MSGHRIERVQSLLKSEITLILQTEIKDPRIDGVYSITHIKLAKDLKNAIVFMSVMGDEEEQNNFLQGLKSSSHFIRKRLGKILTLKYIPHLQFKIDDSIEKGVNLYYKLKKMEEEERELGWYDKENE